MLVKIKISNEINAKSFNKQADAFFAPAVLLDTSLRVLAKNAEAAKRFPRLKVGASVVRRLDKLAYAHLRGMTKHETCTVDFRHENKFYRANAICGDGCITLVFHAPNSNLQGNLCEKYVSLSGYDIDFFGSGADLQADEKGSRASRLVGSLLEKQYEPKRCVAFRVENMLDAIRDGIARKMPELADRIRILRISENITAEGSERDFTVASIALISLCIRRGVGEVFVSSAVRGEELSLRIGTKTESNGVFDAENGIYLLKLLANGNMWELDERITDGGIEYILTMPLYNGGEEFLVRDVPADLVSFALRELFSDFDL